MHEINIIVRTHKRPAAFRTCIESILKQTYENINIYVGVENDDSQTMGYVMEYASDRLHVVRYDRISTEIDKPANIIDYEYGKWFPFNKYLDLIGAEIKAGFVMYLDDDDMLSDEKSVERIADVIVSENDLIFWRVRLAIDKVVPNDASWFHMCRGNEPVAYHVSGIGFGFHYKFLCDIEWGYWTIGDYRVSKKLFQLCNKTILINAILSQVQQCQNYGNNQ